MSIPYHYLASYDPESNTTLLEKGRYVL
jgi:hypothetical protein